MTSLFLPRVDPHQFFEKGASISKMPDDDQKWPSHILSEMYRHLPYISRYDVDISMQRVEPEAGFAFGHALVINKNDPNAATESKNAENHIRIPIIVADRQLQPFHTFEVGKEIYPLTSERVEAAMLNPAIFDGPAKKPRRMKSMIDQLYPPYEQRQGFGRVISGGAAKTAALRPSEMTPEQLETYAKLKRHRKMDTHMEGLSAKERTSQAVSSGIVPTSVGATLGAAKGAVSAKGGGWRNRLLSAQGGAITGAITGAGIHGVNTSVQSHRRAKRQKQRKEMGLKQASWGKKLIAGGAASAVAAGAGHSVGEKKGKKTGRKEGLRTGYVIGGRRGYLTGLKHGRHEKAATVALSFDPGRRVPSNMVLRDAKAPLAPGIVASDIHFFPVPGTKYVIGVHKTLAKKLSKLRDQKEIRQALVGPMRSEIRAARANRKSPGLFLLFSQKKRGYEYHKPSATPGLG